MSVVRRPSPANAAERVAGFGALQSLSENRPRTSEGAGPLGSGFLSSNDACEARGEPVSHLKALRVTARERRGVGFDDENDENDENAPRFGAHRSSLIVREGDPAHIEADLEDRGPTHASASVFNPPPRVARRFERKPPPFERPPRPATARAPDATATATTLADGAPPREVLTKYVAELPGNASATITATTGPGLSREEDTHPVPQQPLLQPPCHPERSTCTPFSAPAAPSVPTVPAHEVAALVAAAVAGEPPRALASAKGAAAAAMASEMPPMPPRA